MKRFTQTPEDGPISFKIARSFELPRPQLFEAWTEPRLLVEWMANSDLEVRIIDCDPRAGGRFHFQLQSSDGREAFGAWQYQEVTPGRRLIFNEHPSNAQGDLLNPETHAALALETRVTFTGFHGVETFLDIESSLLSGSAQQRTWFEIRRSGLAKAWDATLGRLEMHCAARRLVHS